MGLGGKRGFSLVELLVVIGIIAVLIGILVPVMHKVRQNGYIADTKNWLSQLQGAIEQYRTEYRTSPGPISNNQIWNSADPPTITAVTVAGFAPPAGNWAGKVTMSENLVLGLLGGLTWTGAAVQYNPSHIGLGPVNLMTGNQKKHVSFIEAMNLSWRETPAGKTGDYLDDSGDADDTIIPEFVDRFPEAMPILYLRSKQGVDTIATGLSSTHNSVMTDDPTAAAAKPREGSYDLSQIKGYTSRPIGTGRTVKASEYKGGAVHPQHGLQTVNTAKTLDKNSQYPYDAFPYFQSQTPNVAKNKDGYILIAPGADRTYGTSDDICSFGEIQ